MTSPGTRRSALDGPGGDDLGSIFAANAMLRPDDVATIFGTRRRTWQEVHEGSNQFANRLLADGLEKGDRVAVMSPSSDLVFDVLAGLAKIGVIAVPINPGLTVPETAHVIKQVSPRLALVHATCADAALEAIGDRAEAPTLVGLEASDAFEVAYEDYIAGADAGDPPVRAEPNDVQVVMWTSGTTGSPKGCLQTQGGTRMALESYLRTIEVPYQGPTMLAPPYFVGVGNFLIFAMARAGITSLIVSRFDPDELLLAVEEHNIAHAFLVQTSLVRLSQHPTLSDYDISSLRMVGYGGSPIAPEVVRRGMAALDCDFYQAYGATEAGGFISLLSPSDHREALAQGEEARLLTAGRPVQHVQISVIDDDGEPVATGALGEIVVKTEAHFVGYYGEPELTESVLFGDEVRTGDIGCLDADGYLSVVDRIKDVIITGGMNVAPSEVERVLHEHPDVLQVAVIGVPDQEWGEAVKAVVKPRPGHHPDPAELIAFARQSLAGFKTPKSVDIVDELPASPAGKLLRRKLREPYWAGKERRI